MPFTTKSQHLTTCLPVRCLPTHSRCLLLAMTLVWLAGCAMPNPKKGTTTRDPFSGVEKFSCGEECPKGSPR